MVMNGNANIYFVADPGDIFSQQDRACFTSDSFSYGVNGINYSQVFSELIVYKLDWLSSVLTNDSMHIGLLTATAHATTMNSRFTIFFNPMTGPLESFILLARHAKAIFHTCFPYTTYPSPPSSHLSSPHTLPHSTPFTYFLLYFLISPSFFRFHQ